MLQSTRFVSLALISVLTCLGSVGGQESFSYRSRGPTSGGYAAQRLGTPAGTPRRAYLSDPSSEEVQLRPASQAAEESASTPPKAKSADTAPAPTGEAAFNRYCTECHEAQKSLQQKKTLAAWRVTVRKMAAMEDADIPPDVHEPIAKYLAARSEAKADDSGQAKDGAAGAKKEQGPDPALVRSGEAAFSAHCTSCHDAEKSLQQKKSLAGWRANVRRMAEKDGANIPQNVHEAIAAYLASRNDGKGGGAGGADDAPSFSLTGTLAPLWRGGGNSDLENPGFFGDVWVGAAWQGKGALSAHATACITCHPQGNNLGRIDLVDAAVRLDVTKWFTSQCGAGCEPALKMAVEMGRFVVPFGAFYQQVNPGLYRTVTAPLIYNMGQRAHPNGLGDPVLPMPYSDQGAVVDLRFPLHDTLNVTFDAYVVNGLQGDTNGVSFSASRSYTDNNTSPAVGGRLAINGKNLRLGASVMGGRFNVDTDFSGTPAPALNYVLYGVDAVYRWEDLLRVQFEYAQRDSDRSPGATTIRDHVGGSYVEGEVLLSRCWKLSLVARYDYQAAHSELPPLGSSLLTGDFATQRFTYGLNKTLPGGSTLMINHEHWQLPGDLHAVDVLGVRWAAMF